MIKRLKNLFTKSTTFTNLPNSPTNLSNSPAINVQVGGEISSARNALGYIAAGVLGSTSLAGLKIEVDANMAHNSTIRHIKEMRKKSTGLFTKHGECKNEAIDCLAVFEKACDLDYVEFKNDKSILAPIAGVQAANPNRTLNEKKIKVLENYTLSVELNRIYNDSTPFPEKEKQIVKLLGHKRDLFQASSVFEVYLDNFIVSFLKFFF